MALFVGLTQDHGLPSCVLKRWAGAALCPHGLGGTHASLTPEVGHASACLRGLTPLTTARSGLEPRAPCPRPWLPAPRTRLEPVVVNGNQEFSRLA